MCPAGTVATGGGGHASGVHGVGRPPLTKSEPEYKDVPGTGKIPVGWRIEVAGNKAADKIRTLVICENAASLRARFRPQRCGSTAGGEDERRPPRRQPC